MPAAPTEKQKAFAVEYASNGGNATEAAKKAGYSEASAHEIGRQQLHRPIVAEMIRNALFRLKARSGAVGLNALIEICEDKKITANARVAAARALCEHAGLLGSGRADQEHEDDTDGQAEKPLSARAVLAELSSFRSANVRSVL